MKKVIVIVGPTTSGKSALGVELARKFDGEIISADSRQVYRELDIGTGKITKREMKGIPHHLLDIANPKRAFSVADFVKKSAASIEKIDTSFIVGGTGYYIDALVGRISVPEVPPNASLRRKLEKKSVTQLFASLQKKDPARATRMDNPSERGNKRRLIRALEIAEALGKSPQQKMMHKYDVLWLGIKPKDIELKIHRRLLRRIKKGMVREAQKLHKKGLTFKRMEELGLEYRSLARFLKKKITKQEMIEELDRDIRHYAKKQLAYWKRNGDIKWFLPSQKSAIEREVRNFLMRI